jgi:hypothetical protein
MLGIACGQEGKLVKKVSISECFNQYKSAIVEKQGLTAYAKLDASTKTRIQKNIQHARNSKKEAIWNLPFMDKLMILSLRHYFSREQLKTINGEAFFAFAVENNHFGLRSVENFELDKIEENGPSASSSVKQNGKAITFSIFFNRENGAWKINLNSLFKLVSSVMKKSMPPGTQKENDHIINILENGSKKKVEADIWNHTL